MECICDHCAFAGACPSAFFPCDKKVCADCRDMRREKKEREENVRAAKIKEMQSKINYEKMKEREENGNAAD